ncbi:protein LNK1-like isoform X3 [Asparagus officinalis]|uniref:protein LNK1-like isoform X3 n=1 Tax=Asparagus officinalis TaxID=4686 RepID=UPI00098E0ADC|nr:protein LNK1-like isoform X3 [Asparagus officinalis]
MYYRGMSGWNFGELEDIDWDVFGSCDDHIVPHQGGEWLDGSSAPSDAHKKPHLEVKNDVEKSMFSKGSATKTALWGKEDAYYPSAKNGCSSILEKSRPHTSNIIVPTLSDEKRNMCSKEPSIGTRILTDDSKSCLSQDNGVSIDSTHLSFLESEQKTRDADLGYYDWPDIGNFEDVDKMFRNWDSTFGQEQTGTVDELSWFSSCSNAIYGSETALEQGFQSSSSDLANVHAKTDSHCTNANLLSKSITATADRQMSTSSNYCQWLDTNALSRGRSTAGKEKSFHGANDIDNAGLSQINSECSLNQNEATDAKQLEGQQSSEGRGTKQSTNQMLLGSDVLAPQIYSSQQFSQQNNLAPNYMHNFDRQSQLDYGIAAHQVSFAQISSSLDFEKGSTSTSSSFKVSDPIVNHPTQCLENLPDQVYMPQVMAPEENMEKLYQGQQLCSTVTAEHPMQHSAFRSKNSVQRKPSGTRDVTRREDVNKELSTVDMDHQTVTESAGVASVSSDDISAKVTGFQQIQDVMHQLDVRTKLCIRDSLYRLARSARQRHGFTTQNFSDGTTDAEGIHGTEASNRSVEFVDAETNTNPIDRSIAQLLFHKPVQHVARSVDDARSLESHMMNQQLHVPITNQASVTNQFNHQSVFGSCTDMETDLS